MPGLVENSQSGKREDLADIMSLVDEKATPFLSRVRKSRKATNTLFEWMVDSYETPHLGGVVDGTDISDFENAAQNRAKLRNHVQIKRRTAKVSTLAQEVSNVAGVSSEIGEAVRKKLVEIKRDIEAALLSSQDAQADNGAVPYLTCGLGLWISTAGPTLYPVPASYRPSASQVNTTAVGSLVEDTHIQAMFQAIYDQTGMTGDYIAVCGSDFRRALTNMTRTIANASASTSKVRTFNMDAAAKKVVHSTTIYEGDYGSVEVVSSNFIGFSSSSLAPDKDRAYILDMDKVHLRFNKLPEMKTLADQGGGPRFFIETIFGLQVDNPIGLGKFQP